MNKLVMAGALIGATVLVGCVSPLRSTDPETRRQAMEKITDDQELFFIAMNIGVGLKDKWPEMYQETHLRSGEYPEDVRVMAVKKIKSAQYLLRCASWKDNDVYEDSASENGRFEYKGETYYLNGNYKANMMEKVSPGDAVRKAAAERLTSAETLRQAALCFDDNARSVLLPSGSHWTGSGYSNGGETTFVDCYGHIRENNPLDTVLSGIVEKETSVANIVAFVYNASESGPVIVPHAYDTAIHKLNGISSKVAVGLFKKVFLGQGGSATADNVKSRSKRERVSNEGKARENAPAGWAWAIYQYIDDPEEDVVVTALKYADSSDAERILGRVKNQAIFLKIFGEEDLAKRVAKDKRKTMRGAYGSEKTDMTIDAAKEMLRPVADNDVLMALATKAKLFSVRYAAIDKISVDEAVTKIANDPMKDCPYDTSLEGCGMFGNGLDWMSATEKKSALKLRSLAISKMKDASSLKNLRKADKSDAVKKVVTERLAALGFSDVDEIIAYEKYDRDLFSMFAEIKKPEDLTKVSKDARLKGMRLLAASKLDENAYAAVAKKEASANKGKPADGKMVVGGYYLGMSIEDLLAKLAVESADVKPTIYLDDEVLCVAGGNGRDIAWANAKSLDVHWIALPPTIVKRIAGFKSGSFEDLERAVEMKLGVSFGYDVIRKGNVSQKIGNLQNTEGETLRYFKSEIGEGEDISRSIRKSINKNSVGSDPFAALGAGLANAFEDAQQADENRANARRPMFQPQGSLQLLLTKNAVKGSLGATGNLGASIGASLGAALKSVVNGNDDLKKIQGGLDELKKAGDEIKGMGKELDNAMDQLKNLSL